MRGSVPRHCLVLSRANVGSSIPFIRSGVHVKNYLKKEQAMPHTDHESGTERSLYLHDPDGIVSDISMSGVADSFPHCVSSLLLPDRH